jgi:hypothetical protein
MSKELTVGDVLKTMTDEQKNVLYYYICSALKKKVKITSRFVSLDTFNDDQKRVFYYLIGRALDEPDDKILEIVKRGNVNGH